MFSAFFHISYFSTTDVIFTTIFFLVTENIILFISTTVLDENLWQIIWCLGSHQMTYGSLHAFNILQK